MGEQDSVPVPPGERFDEESCWQRFAASGSVYDYLDYKTQMEKNSYADSDDGLGAARSEGGGS